VEEVGVLLRGDARIREQLLRRTARKACGIERVPRDFRAAGEIGLRLGLSVRLLVDGGIRDPVQLCSEVLLDEENVGARAVQLLLVKREGNGRSGDQDDSLEDDPPPAPYHTQVIPQRRPRFSLLGLDHAPRLPPATESSCRRRRYSTESAGSAMGHMAYR
jgi:hypothetical protein